MGKIVAAAWASHAPQILWESEGEDPEQLKKVHAALTDAGHLIYDSKPDALLVVANDHVNTFFFDNYPAFCIFVGTSCEGSHKTKQGIKNYRFEVHEPLARNILFQALEDEFDLSFSQYMPLQGAWIVPLNWMMPDQSIPIVPLHVNGWVTPQPSPKRCYKLGQELAKIIAMRPKDERVAILATGGLSHFPGTPRYGTVNADFDKDVMTMLAEGRGSRLADYSSSELNELGDFELRNWITALGAVGDVPVTTTMYEASWHCGYGVAYCRIDGK